MSGGGHGESQRDKDIDRGDTWKGIREIAFKYCVRQRYQRRMWVATQQGGLLTSIGDEAILIFLVHAVLEDLLDLIVAQCLSCKRNKQLVFVLLTNGSLSSHSPKANMLCFSSAKSIRPFSFLSYNFKHSRKSS